SCEPGRSAKVSSVGRPPFGERGEPPMSYRTGHGLQLHTAARAHDQLGGPMTAAALPPVVDAGTWQRQLDALRAREKAATRELDAIAAQRRRLPMVEMPDYTLEGEQGPIRLVDVFDGKSQLIVYNHMWFPG